MKQLVVILFFLSPVWLFSQAHYSFMYEKGFSAHSGAENLIAANYIYGTVDKNYIPANIFKEKKAVGKLGNMAYRFAKFWYVDLALNGWGFVTQHEYFGHTVRAKQSGYKDAYPVIGVPYFRKEGAKTYLGNLYRHNTSYELKLVYAGGSEANNVLARKLFIKTLMSDKILYQQSLMFFGNNTYQSLGLLFVNDISDIVDINVYNMSLNYIGDNEKVQKQFKTLALLDVISDPMNYIALFSIFKNYLYGGKHVTNIPMLNIGKDVRYLPNFRFTLAPYSPEVVYENYLVFDKKLLKVSFRHSSLTKDLSFGFDFQLYNIWVTDKINFDSKISVWKQSRFIIKDDQNENIIINPNLRGFAFINTMYYKFNKRYNISVMADIGYKTNGYLEGEKLKSGLILRGGLSFEFE